MFDDLIAKPRPKRWKSAVIVGSALVHAGALTAVVVAAMWHIEKLDVANDMDITYRVPTPQGAAAPPPAAKLAVRTPTPAKVLKIKVDVPVQPTLNKDPEPVTTGPSTTTDPAAGKDGPGGDGTDPDADPDSTGTCLQPPCVEGSDGDPPEPDPEPIIKKKPPIVPPNVAKGLRVGGNDQIHPPEMVRVDMMHQHKDMISATLQLCVGTDGRVESTRVMKSTGFKSYDDRIAGEVRDWTYKPYRVDGVASPMCTVTMFVYRMRK